MNQESSSTSTRTKSMEFDFVTVDSTSKLTPSPQRTEPAAMHKEIPLDKDPSAVVFKAPERKTSTSTPSSTMNSSSTATPLRSAVNARENIQRQQREQKTFNTLMGSAATFVLIGSLIFLGLAGLGGYVLWSQIQKQSVTVALLETNMRREMSEMQITMQTTNQKLQQDFDATALKINRLTALAEEQKSIISSLNSTVENQKTQLRQQDSQMKQIRSDIYRITGRKRS